MGDTDMTEQQLISYRRYRQVDGPGLTAAILIGAVTALNAASTLAIWRGYALVRDYRAGHATFRDVASNDDAIFVLSSTSVILLLAAAAIFLIWLRRARVNTEEMASFPHRRARPWVVWGWICPVVNLWFPFQIVEDVYDASRPGELAEDATPAQARTLW
jgi:Domain of unknown function (DUF4328)